MKIPKILIVDDTEAILTGIKFILEAYHYETVCATDGLKALEIIAKEPFDLIIMDLNMPNLDGAGAAGKIRETDKTIPIIAYSSHDADYMQQNQDRYTSFTEILSKPADIKNLVKIVKKYLG